MGYDPPDPGRRRQPRLVIDGLAGRPSCAPAILGLVGLFACAPAGNGAGWEVLMTEAGEAETTRISGSVTHLDLEGGLWVLRATDGTSYNPTNLPEAYHVEGAAFEADVIVRDDMASIGMVGPIVHVVRIRLPDGARPSLWGTSWRLEDLAGRGVLDAVQATLEFRDAGRVVGHGSCNRFSGTAEVSGDSISIGPLAMTRMACPEAVGDQEARYVRALEEAVSFRIDEPFLYVRSSGLAEPLRLIRTDGE